MTQQQTNDSANRPWFMNWAAEAPPAWPAFGNFVGAVEPVTRSAARANLELTSLAGKRAQAYMAIPDTLRRCRSPIDVFQAQVAFWQLAAQQYQDATRHVLESWQGALPSAGGAQAADKVQPRDYITFPEPKSEEQRPAGTRRAA